MKQWIGQKNTHTKIKRYTLVTRLRSILYVRLTRMDKESLS